MYRTIFAVVFLLLALDALAMNTDLVGKWKGGYETPTGSGVIEVTLSHQDKEWKAVCKFPEVDDEENTFLAEELKVSEMEVSFLIEVENKSGQMRFKGKPVGEKIEGRFERFIEGKSVYTGLWNIERSK